jgi:hypothetical protein
MATSVYGWLLDKVFLFLLPNSETFTAFVHLGSISQSELEMAVIQKLIASSSKSTLKANIPDCPFD